MKKFLSIITLFLLFLITNLHAQNFSVVPHETSLQGDLGSTVTFHIDLINNSGSDLTLAIVRTQNELPAGWTSSICLDVCYQSTQDSVQTSQEFGSSPIASGETRELKIIVDIDSTTGIGYIGINIFDPRNPAESVLVNLEPTSLATSVGSDNRPANSYWLNQNYPNPFNPSTNISFNLAEAGNVSITVFDLLGRVVAEPMNEYRSAGLHSFNFDASELSSGTYFYRVESQNFVQTKKMILEK
jgi:hypothetical protein